MDFEPGQLVTLKSGGPPLTVASVAAGNVRCVWFAHADDRLQEANIPAVCLDALGDEEGDDFDTPEDAGRDRRPGR
jgi:uncharacterized protein YodC (DUF2158 family)